MVQFHGHANLDKVRARLIAITYSRIKHVDLFVCPRISMVNTIVAHNYCVNYIDSLFLLGRSVLVIIAVNVASEYGTLAAAIATAPTGTPLSLWVMVQQNPHRKPEVLRE
jgi:hypothetical protein